MHSARGCYSTVIARHLLTVEIILMCLTLGYMYCTVPTYTSASFN